MSKFPAGKSKVFTIFWLDGSKEVLTTEDSGTLMEVFETLDYDEEIREGIDFCVAGESDDYRYSEASKKWIRRPVRQNGAAMACLNGLVNIGEFS